MKKHLWILLTVVAIGGFAVLGWNSVGPPPSGNVTIDRVITGTLITVDTTTDGHSHLYYSGGMAVTVTTESLDVGESVFHQPLVYQLVRTGEYTWRENLIHVPIYEIVGIRSPGLPY